MPGTEYSPNAVVSRNGGGSNLLSDNNPLVIVDTGPGSAKIMALQDPLESAACDTTSVTGAFTLLAAGSSQTVGPGTRTAIRRGTATGLTPFGLNWL